MNMKALQSRFWLKSMMFLCWMPFASALSQGLMDLSLQTSVINWGTVLYKMDGMGRGTGLEVQPEFTLVSDNMIFNFKLSRSGSTFKTDIVDYEFYIGEERMLWQMKNVTFSPVRWNSEIFFGVMAGRRTKAFITLKYVNAAVNQSVPASEYRFDTVNPGWKRVGDKDVIYSRGGENRWYGFGCQFTAPVYWSRYLLKGDVRYYIWGSEGINVIQGELLFCIPFQRNISFYTGGKFEVTTASEVQGSLFGLCCGLIYTVRKQIK